MNILNFTKNNNIFNAHIIHDNKIIIFEHQLYYFYE
jgi:hypothetical protein